MFLTLQDLQGDHVPDADYEDKNCFRDMLHEFIAWTALLIRGLFKETVGDGTLLAGNSKDIYCACRAASVLGCVSFNFSVPCMFSFNFLEEPMNKFEEPDQSDNQQWPAVQH